MDADILHGLKSKPFVKITFCQLTKRPYWRESHWTVEPGPENQVLWLHKDNLTKRPYWRIHTTQLDKLTKWPYWRMHTTQLDKLTKRPYNASIVTTEGKLANEPSKKKIQH